MQGLQIFVLLLAPFLASYLSFVFAKALTQLDLRERKPLYSMCFAIGAACTFIAELLLYPPFGAGALFAMPCMFSLFTWLAYNLFPKTYTERCGENCGHPGDTRYVGFSKKPCHILHGGDTLAEPKIIQQFSTVVTVSVSILTSAFMAGFSPCGSIALVLLLSPLVALVGIGLALLSLGLLYFGFVCAVPTITNLTPILVDKLTTLADRLFLRHN